VPDLWRSRTIAIPVDEIGVYQDLRPLTGTEATSSEWLTTLQVSGPILEL
jgi:hypothetical protein